MAIEMRRRLGVRVLVVLLRRSGVTMILILWVTWRMLAVWLLLMVVVLLMETKVLMTSLGLVVRLSSSVGL